MPASSCSARCGSRRLPTAGTPRSGPCSSQAPRPGRAGNAGLTAVSPPPAWPGFRPLTVTAVERESDSVISVPLGRPRRGRAAARPARAVPDPAAAAGARRAAAAAQLLAVRRRRVPTPTASASSASHTARPASTCTPGCAAGDAAGGGRPARHFHPPDRDAPVLLISAGVGATPVLAMLHALADSGSGRDVWWLHGARNRAEEPFAAEARSAG